MRNAIGFMALTLFLAACAAPSTPTPSPTSTRTPAPSPTLEPTLSPTPILSTTPGPTQSLTPSPSSAPEPTVSVTSSFLFGLPLDTPTPSSGLQCKLIWKSIRKNTKFSPHEKFPISWKVTNTGSVTWNPDSVDFTYFGGTKMYLYPLVELKTSVAPGQDVVLTADMRAPKNSTKYITTWSLRQGDTYFCRVTLTIYVE